MFEDSNVNTNTKTGNKREMKKIFSWFHYTCMIYFMYLNVVILSINRFKLFEYLFIKCLSIKYYGFLKVFICKRRLRHEYIYKNHYIIVKSFFKYYFHIRIRLATTIRVATELKGNKGDTITWRGIKTKNRTEWESEKSYHKEVEL